MKTLFNEMGLLPEIVGAAITLISVSAAYLALASWTDMFVTIFIGG